MPFADDIASTANSLVTRGLLRTLRAFGDPLAIAATATSGPDAYDLFRSIRERGPLVRSRLGVLVSASHSVGSAVLRDPRFGLRSRTARPAAARSGSFNWRDRPADVVPPISESILALDPPDHTRLRALVTGPFRPAALANRAAAVEKTARTLIEGLDKWDSFDFVEDFAAPLPVLTICEVLDIDATDHRRFARWGAAIGVALGGVARRGDVHAAREALISLNAFFDELIAARRRSPGKDIISELVRARDDDGVLTDRELKASCLILFVAGFETMVNLLGNGMRALLDNPDQWALLRADPGLAGAAVEELLRFDPPVQLTSRIAHEDVEVAGRSLAEGTTVTVLLGGANRDPDVFDLPDRLDLARRNARSHIAFSGGVHYCLGAPLARLQAEIAFRAVAERMPDLVFAGEPVQARARSIRGLSHLPLRRTGQASV